jgi:hypothetical protein
MYPNITPGFNLDEALGETLDTNMVRTKGPTPISSIHVRPRVRVFLGEGAPMDPVLPFPSSAPLGRNDFVVL